MLTGKRSHMNVHDWFDWSNVAVGGVGLALTITAIVQATGAKTAARRTERSVLRHNAEADFASLALMAKELHGFVEAGKMSEARLRATDLRSDLASAIQLHEAFLGSQRQRLESKQLDLTLVAAGLNRTGGDLSQAEKVRLLRITGAILDLLSGQFGKLRSSVEERYSDG